MTTHPSARVPRPRRSASRPTPTDWPLHLSLRSLHAEVAALSTLTLRHALILTSTVRPTVKSRAAKGPLDDIIEGLNITGTKLAHLARQLRPIATVAAAADAVSTALSHDVLFEPVPGIADDAEQQRVIRAHHTMETLATALTQLRRALESSRSCPPR